MKTVFSPIRFPFHPSKLILTATVGVAFFVVGCGAGNSDSDTKDTKSDSETGKPAATDETDKAEQDGSGGADGSGSQ